MKERMKDQKPANQKADPERRGPMHGEGNPEADKRYRENLQRFAGSEESRKKAREAAESVDDEGRPRGA